MSDSSTRRKLSAIAEPAALDTVPKVPFCMTANVGSNKRPVYVEGKQILAFTENIGNETTPIYMKNGEFVAGRSTANVNIETNPEFEAEPWVARFTLNPGTPEAHEYVVHAAAGGGGGTFTNLNVPLLTPMWFDHVPADSKSWIVSDGEFHDGTVDAYTKIYNHLITECQRLDGVWYENDKTMSFGSIEVRYHECADGHRVCICDTTDAETVRTSLNSIVDSHPEFGTAWFYIINKDEPKFYLPRTRYGFHGDLGYVKFRYTDDQAMRLYFHTGLGPGSEDKMDKVTEANGFASDATPGNLAAFSSRTPGQVVDSGHKIADPSGEPGESDLVTVKYMKTAGGAGGVVDGELWKDPTSVPITVTGLQMHTYVVEHDCYLGINVFDTNQTADTTISAYVNNKLMWQIGEAEAAGQGVDDLCHCIPVKAGSQVMVKLSVATRYTNPSIIFSEYKFKPVSESGGSIGTGGGVIDGSVYTTETIDVDTKVTEISYIVQNDCLLAILPVSGDWSQATNKHISVQVNGNDVARFGDIWPDSHDASKTSHAIPVQRSSVVKIVKSDGKNIMDVAGSVKFIEYKLQSLAPQIAMPNYDVTSMAVTNGWTATQNGWIVCRTGTNNGTAYVYVNGIEVVGLQANSGGAYFQNKDIVPISEGDKVTYNGNTSVYFFPCKPVPQSNASDSGFNTSGGTITGATWKAPVEKKITAKGAQTVEYVTEHPCYLGIHIHDLSHNGATTIRAYVNNTLVWEMPEARDVGNTADNLCHGIPVSSGSLIRVEFDVQLTTATSGITFTEFKLQSLDVRLAMPDWDESKGKDIESGYKATTNGYVVIDGTQVTTVKVNGVLAGHGGNGANYINFACPIPVSAGDIITFEGRVSEEPGAKFYPCKHVDQDRSSGTSSTDTILNLLYPVGSIYLDGNNGTVCPLQAALPGSAWENVGTKLMIGGMTGIDVTIWKRTA